MKRNRISKLNVLILVCIAVSMMIYKSLISERPIDKLLNSFLFNENYFQHLYNNTIVYDNITWITPSSFNIECVNSATILYPHGLVFNQSKPFNFGKWYWRKDEKNINKIRTSGLNAAFAYSLVQIWDNFFQHIAFDTIPRIVFSCNWLQHHFYVIIIIMNNLQRDLITLFCNLKSDRFYVLNRTVSFSSICVPFFDRSDISMGLLPPNSIKSLGCQKKVGTEIIYVARKRGKSRWLKNEEEIILTIKKKWQHVKVVYPTGDWKIDRNTFKNARIIIGPHGGGFGNMIFAPCNTTVIEFLPLKTLKLKKENERPCYFGLAHALGFVYYAIEPQYFDFEKPMIMSVSNLKHVLSKLE